MDVINLYYIIKTEFEDFVKFVNLNFKNFTKQGRPCVRGRWSEG